MKTRTVLIVVVVLAVIAAAGFFLFAQPVSASNYQDDPSLDYRTANANLYGAMAAAGINDSFTDVDESHAYVAYELPAGYDSDLLQRYVLGAEANAASNSTTLVAVQYVNDAPKTMWTVATEDFKAFVRGEITGAQLDAKIQKQAF